MVRAGDAGQRLAGLVACCLCLHGRGLGDRRCSLRSDDADGVGEVDLQVDVTPDRPGQPQRATHQRGGGALVAAPERPAAGGGEPLSRPLGEAVVRLPQLPPIAGGLLQVVAEHLVQLQERRSVAFQPVGEALVQLGPKLLGHRPVDGVADEDVHEPEAVLAGEVRRLRTHEVPPDRTEQMSARLRPFVRWKQGGDGAAVKHRPLDRRPLQQVSLGRREPVEAGGEQRLDRRRQDELLGRTAVSRLVGEQLLEEERVPGGGLRDLRPP